MGSTVFRIPSDVIKPSGYRPRVLYTSSGILNTVDPLASASNLYIDKALHYSEVALVMQDSIFTTAKFSSVHKSA